MCLVRLNGKFFRQDSGGWRGKNNSESAGSE